ncbi:DUF6397 family protein [Streptomyces sp. NPDC056652]|uniref:DUF6397 family protein n=1 Tax=Streptomyces sp. NPDC056652 TaxID=3345893 RepID=UPI0036A63CD0
MSVSDAQSQTRNDDAGETNTIAVAATAATAATAETAGKEPRSVGADRAARELELRRGEFELAAQLGHIRTITIAGATTAGSVTGMTLGRRQVTRLEIDRLRAAEGFPDTLRERVRTVGTAEGAALMPVSPGRFTRLARSGFIVPVRFYLNRYRAVVWLYLAEELRSFAIREPALLAGRFPRPLRAGLEAGEDWRPRNWRGRRIGQLLHESGDPWERAAIAGSVLDPVQLAELVADPYERAYLERLRPDLGRGRPESEAARTAVQRLLVADHPDEIQWHQASLDTLLTAARRVRPAPRPGSSLPHAGDAARGHEGTGRAPAPAPARAPGHGIASRHRLRQRHEPVPAPGATGPAGPGRAGPAAPASGSTAVAHEPPRAGGRRGLLTRLRVRSRREGDRPRASVRS